MTGRQSVWPAELALYQASFEAFRLRVAMRLRHPPRVVEIMRAGAEAALDHAETMVDDLIDFYADARRRIFRNRPDIESLMGAKN